MSLVLSGWSMWGFLCRILHSVQLLYNTCVTLRSDLATLKWSRFEGGLFAFKIPLSKYCTFYITALGLLIFDLETLFRTLYDRSNGQLALRDFDKTLISHLSSTVFYWFVALLSRAVSFVVTFGSISCRLVPYRILRYESLRSSYLPGTANDIETLQKSD